MPASTDEERCRISRFGEFARGMALIDRQNCPRFLAHLVACDANDAWAFAWRNPAALREELAA